MREDRTKWHREFLLKYAQTASADRQALAEQFAAGYLIAEHPDGEREKVFVPLSGSLTLGRAPDGVMLKDVSISLQAALIRSADRFALRQFPSDGQQNGAPRPSIEPLFHIEPTFGQTVAEVAS